ncbi:MAG TPA: exodeoxyribonuclease VII large subunit, partial [Draconibacterium sp.]|nr:exodeoxyribonuclease VII large subunit [Draconibacterium sp.]
MNQQLTLSELNELIKDALLDAFPGTVWVVAEVSELKQNRSGHCYLELVEKEGNTITARSRATIWSYTFRMLKPYFETTTGQLFSEGIKVLVQATVEYHPAYGLSLNIKDIDPTYTVGDMAMQRKEIINRLKAE